MSNISKNYFFFSLLEMDDAIGQILDRLDVLNLTNTTLVYFMSDHGSHIDKGALGGSNAGFKGTTNDLRDSLNQAVKPWLTIMDIYVYFGK